MRVALKVLVRRLMPYTTIDLLQQELFQITAVLAGIGAVLVETAVVAELVREGGMETSKRRAGTKSMPSVRADGSGAQPSRE